MRRTAISRKSSGISNLTSEEQEEMEKVLEQFRIVKIKVKLWEMLLRNKCKVCNGRRIEDCYNCLVYKYLNKIMESLYSV